MKILSSLSDPAAADLLNAGKTAVIPTDTVYGLVACAQDERAVTDMYALKQRARQPGTIIAANTDQLEDLGFSPASLAVAAPYWPGAISVILDATNVPTYLKTDLPELAVRIPDHEELRALLEQTGPLMTTSANAPHEPTATNLDSAQAYFADRVGFYVDAGELGDRPPSTIIRIHDGDIEVIRLGAVELS